MIKRSKWKIAVAVLAILIAGTVYCIFFTEEKEDMVLYQSGETGTETVINSFTTGTGNNDIQTENKTDTILISHVPAQEEADSAEERQKLIFVHVCGAVKNPGVYSLVQSSRVCDAIVLAGGLTETAADDYVNQARFLNDGERVYIPEIDELSNLSPSQYAAGQSVGMLNGSQGGSSEQKMVNINTAGVSELTTLPGIGESRAESIVAYREQHGSFARIEDIMKISGIKGAAYEKIKDRICTGNE